MASSDSHLNLSSTSSPSANISLRSGACSACRARKVKCSAHRPICATCTKNEIVCRYPAHVDRKRKRKDDPDVEGDPHDKRSTSAAYTIRDHRSVVQLDRSATQEQSSLGSDGVHYASEVHTAVVQPAEALFHPFDYTAQSDDNPLRFQDSQPASSSAFVLDSHPKLHHQHIPSHTYQDTRSDTNDFQSTLQELLALPVAFDPSLFQAYPDSTQTCGQNELNHSGRHTHGDSQQLGSTGVGLRSSSRRPPGKYRVPYFRYERSSYTGLNLADNLSLSCNNSFL